MSTESYYDLEEPLLPSVRQMQLVTGGLTLSPILFTIITYFTPMLELNQEAAKLLIGLGLLLGLIVLVSFRPLGRFVAHQSGKSIELAQAVDHPASLAGAYHSGMFLTTAICNGAAFVNLLAYWVTRSPMSLLMGIMLIASATTQIPRLEAVANWVGYETESRRKDA